MQPDGRTGSTPRTRLMSFPSLGLGDPRSKIRRAAERAGRACEAGREARKCWPETTRSRRHAALKITLHGAWVGQVDPSAATRVASVAGMGGDQ